MRTRNHPRHVAPAENNNSISWIYVLMTILCAAFLATGFFFAARQHFTAMDLGIKNSKLRKQVEDMEGEKRRLLLSREVVRSPGEIKRAALKHGLRDGDDLFAPVQIAAKPDEDRGHIEKTALTFPVQASSEEKKAVKAFYPKGIEKVPMTAKASRSGDAGRSKRVAIDLIASAKVR